MMSYPSLTKIVRISFWPLFTKRPYSALSPPQSPPIFLDVKKEFDGFYKKRNVPGLKEKASEMREILSDLELLNSFHNRASLDKWIEDARSLGDTDELKNYYEKNARNLITTWGGSLNDYASRTWAGLLNDYYARRWEIYFDAVIGAAEKGIELDKDELKSRLLNKSG